MAPSLEFLSMYDLDVSWYASVAAVFVVSAFCYVLYVCRKPSFPSNAPQVLATGYPLLGCLDFFGPRWDFHHRLSQVSKTGQFSYYVGSYPVVGLSGHEGRSVFFDSKNLHFAAGYNVMFGQSPDYNDIREREDGVEHGTEYSNYFTKRLVALLKKENFDRNLPVMVSDTRNLMTRLSTSGITDPFESIYEMVYQLTMRTVGANDIAEDPVLLRKTLHLFEVVESSATASTVIFPKLPTWSKIKRTLAGGQLYMIFKKIVDERKATGRRDNDALQFLMDHDDSLTDMLIFVISALFAGQINSGINAAFTLVYMASDSYWQDKAREEVRTVANKYAVDKSASLVDQLQHIPLAAWESEFPICDMALRDSIRLNLTGTGFRRNISGADVQVGKEVIPHGAFVTYAIGDAHLDSTIYKDPLKWDPSRYLPERAEDKKTPHAFVGWGSGRHPCLGMRFAKLEQNIIVAHFLASFERFSMCDKAGNAMELPLPEVNNLTAKKPRTKIFLKYGPKV